MWGMATKTLKALPETKTANVSPNAAKAVRNAKTGQSVTIKGVGALKGGDLEIMKGVNLLKPIAEQALAQRSEKRKAR